MDQRTDKGDGVNGDLESTLFEPHAKMGPEECFIERYMFSAYLKCQGIIRQAARLGISFDELATMNIDKIDWHLNQIEGVQNGK